MGQFTPDIRKRVKLRFPSYSPVARSQIEDFAKALLQEYEMYRNELERRISDVENNKTNKEEVENIVDEKLQAALSRMQVLAGNAPKDD